MDGEHDCSPGFCGTSVRARREIGALVLVRGTAGVVLAGAVAAAVSAQQPVSGARALVFDRVTVVDVEQGKLVPDQRVVIIGNRIRTMRDVGAVRRPKGAQVVDARGKYLMPGLWDMHVHVGVGTDVIADSLYRDLYPRFIAHGVTGIREMGQRFQNGADSFRVWQREVLAGTRVGPRGIGPSADVSKVSSSMETPEQVMHVVDSLKAAGDAFVKFHGLPSDPQTFFALLREARRVGLPVVGHVPYPYVREVEAVDSGMRSVEHARAGGPRDCWPDSRGKLADSVTLGPDSPGTLADSVALEKACAPIAEAYIRNGTWFTPTLTVMLFFSDTSALPGTTNPPFADVLRYVRTMHRLGVTKVLAGTDFIPFALEHEPEFLPGLSANEELVFLAAAGLSPVEALQAGTLNPAKFLDATDSLGTVAAGKLADLVLLDANPLADITNVLKIRAVVANGRYFDRPALDAFDPEGTKSGRGMIAVQRRLDGQTGSGPSPLSPTSP